MVHESSNKAFYLWVVCTFCKAQSDTHRLYINSCYKDNGLSHSCKKYKAGQLIHNEKGPTNQLVSCRQGVWENFWDFCLFGDHRADNLENQSQRSQGFTHTVLSWKPSTILREKHFTPLTMTHEFFAMPDTQGQIMWLPRSVLGHGIFKNLWLAEITEFSWLITLQYFFYCSKHKAG